MPFIEALAIVIKLEIAIKPTISAPSFMQISIHIFTIRCPPEPEISKIYHQYLFFCKTPDNRARLDEQIEHLNSIPMKGICVWICTISDRQFPRNSECNVHQNINTQYLSRPRNLGLIKWFLIFSVAALCLLVLSWASLD